MDTAEDQRRLKTLRWLALVIGVALIALAAYGANLGYRKLFDSRPIGSGPAGPAVPKEVFASAWSERPVLFVGLGDSMTAGFGAKSGYSYFARLAASPPDEFADIRDLCLAAVFPKLTVTNLAVSGSVSHDVARFQLPGLPLQDENTFGWVVITTGGNDLIHNYGKTPPTERGMFGATWDNARPWVAGYEQRLEQIIGQVNAAFPGGCHIFIGNIYDPTDGSGDIQRAGLPLWQDGLRILSAYNDAIRRCAQKHQNVQLVDIHGAFLGHGIDCSRFWAKHYDAADPHYWYYYNLEDPNERGHDAIRRLFLLEMAKVALKLWGESK